MSLKLNVAILCAAAFVGFLIGRSVQSTAPPSTVGQKQSTECKVTKVTKVNADGSREIAESFTASGSQTQSTSIQPLKSLSRYSIGAQGLKTIDSISADARLGEMPLFVGGVLSRDNFKVQLRLEF